MPIYEYQCGECKLTAEKFQKIGGEAPNCPECGVGMTKKPTHLAMVKIKGEGGFPSRRREWRGTAPYTQGYDSTRDKNSEWYKGESIAE